MPVLIGTSGWQYRDWRGRFYPENVPQKKWLEHYAGRFQIVESNAVFYRLPEHRTFVDWARRTRTILSSPSMGPVLVQLPPTLKADLRALKDTLRQFGDRVRVAVEFRHESWLTDEVRAALESKGAALCLADRGSRPVTPVWRTAD